MVEFSQYIDYLCCSLRHTHYSSSPKLTFQHAKAISLSETSRYYFSGMAARGKVSLKAMKRRLGRVWNRVRMTGRLSYNWDDILSIQEQLTKVTSLVGPRDHVLLSGYPTVLDTKFDNVVGSIDAIVLKNQHRSDKYLQVILFDYFSYPNLTKESSILKLSAGYYDMALRKDNLSTLPRKYTFYQLATGRLQSLAVTRYGDKRTLKLLENIKNGIDRGVHVPTVNPNVCQDCVYSFSCDWRQ